MNFLKAVVIICLASTLFLIAQSQTGYIVNLNGNWQMGGPAHIGQPCQIIQQGNVLTFINEKGERSSGHIIDANNLNSASTVVAHDWGELQGTVSADGSRIDWANGSWWVRGTGTGTGNAEIVQFTWIGKDADMVAGYDNGMPDGYPDGHFVLDLNLPVPTEIKSISIYSADSNGNIENHRWHTAIGDYWILGVFDRGKQLNNHHVISLGTFSGDKKFDLYISPQGINPYYGIEVTLGDGKTLKSLATGESN